LKEQLKQCYIREPCRDVFADEFLRLLGAAEYTSIDRSDYEGASFLHDLNDPFPEKMRDHFDFVLDGGTLEHVFHYTAGLKHSLELVRVGWHFMTITPQRVHGPRFLPILPGTFLRHFLRSNGFNIRKIVIYESYGRDTQFFEVRSPAQLGSRVELTTSPPVFIAVLAQKTATVPIFAQPPQQSDYVAVWSAGENPTAPPTSLGRIRTALILAFLAAQLEAEAEITNPWRPQSTQPEQRQVIQAIQRGSHGR